MEKTIDVETSVDAGGVGSVVVISKVVCSIVVNVPGVAERRDME